MLSVCVRVLDKCIMGYFAGEIVQRSYGLTLVQTFAKLCLCMHTAKWVRKWLLIYYLSLDKFKTFLVFLLFLSVFQFSLSDFHTKANKYFMSLPCYSFACCESMC